MARSEEKKPESNWFWIAMVAFVCTVMSIYRPEPRKIQLPTAEQIGESTGKKAVPFAKGFVKGVTESVGK